MSQRIRSNAVLGRPDAMACLFTFTPIRRGELRQGSASIRFAANPALTGVSPRRDSLEAATKRAGIAHAPSALALGVIVLGFAPAMPCALAPSRLTERNKRRVRGVDLPRPRREAPPWALGPRDLPPPTAMR